MRPLLEALEGRWAPAVLTVTTAADSGPGSLRQALLDANAAAGPDTIDFAIGSGPQTIAPSSPLPAVTDPVTIDGTSQPGYAGTPLIELRGDLAGASNGLAFDGGGNTVRGLTVNRFAYFGIVLRSSNNTVQGCYVGTTAAGTAAAGNGFSGIFVSGNNNLVGGTAAGQRNVLSANGFHGVQLQNGATGNVVEGNTIGLTADGSAALGNTYDGVAVFLGAHDNTVGATAAGVGSGNVIAGNGRAGVSVLSSGTTRNQVGGNLVGTGAAGTAALANGIGVWLLGGATANTVGGAAAGAGNVLSGNSTYGVEIDGSGTTGNLVLGNTVGLAAGGTAKLANRSSGVLLATGASGNTVGGTTAAARNLIAGNGNHGVEVRDAGTSANLIEGNILGSNASGAAGLGNAFDGAVVYAGATSNSIGGTAAGAGNEIVGNGRAGVTVLMPGTAGNQIEGNSIGLTAAGAVLANQRGVWMLGGASGNTVGGTAAGARNVISGNGDVGVWLTGPNTTGNSVQGNYIGTDAAGGAARPNGLDGVQTFQGAAGNIIGGAAAGAGNVISGNSRYGVALFTAEIQVAGNYIGLNAAGTAAVPNVGDGVEILTGNNTVGGTAAGARNVISGNAGDGVVITGRDAFGNVVEGNYVGTDAAGTAAVPNFTGVTIGFAAFNTVGGTAAGAGNVISGNAFGGVHLSGPGTTGNVVEGNYVGTNAAGAAALPNSGNGVLIEAGAANNTVGGAAAGARNVISGNTAAGVDVTGTGFDPQRGVQATSGNVVAGNYVGTDAAGTAALGNTDGVVVSDHAAGNTVGGTAAGDRNVISGNARHGVLLETSATGNVLAGDYVGVAADGVTPLGNGSQGVFIQAQAAVDTVGGTAAGSGNVIAFNGANGVLIGADAVGSGEAGTGNAVEGNSIHDNGALGIDLGPDDGVTPNDPGDADTGPNNLQNYPVITGVAAGGSGGTNITFTLDSTPSTAFRVEFFANAAADPSGHGEGQTFLGFADVTTDASGHVATTVNVAGTVPAGQKVTATATDPAGNTSEFSADF